MGIQRKHAYSPSFRGTRTRAAGDIFPYTIVLVGQYDSVKYHVMGQGFVADDVVYDTYQAAHDHATIMLNF